MATVPKLYLDPTITYMCLVATLIVPDQHSCQDLRFQSYLNERVFVDFGFWSITSPTHWVYYDVE